MRNKCVVVALVVLFLYSAVSAGEVFQGGIKEGEKEEFKDFLGERCKKDDEIYGSIAIEQGNRFIISCEKYKHEGGEYEVSLEFSSRGFLEEMVIIGEEEGFRGDEMGCRRFTDRHFECDRFVLEERYDDGDENKSVLTQFRWRGE